MDEETRESREVERPPRPKRLGGRSQRSDEWPERVGGSVGQRSFGFDVEDPDHSSTREQRDRKLGGHAREGRDVVGIRAHVDCELRTSESYRPSGYSALDGDPVRDDGVAALRDEPEPSVLEHEDRRHCAGDGLVEDVDRSFDCARGLVVGADRVRGSLRSRSQQTGIDRPDDTRSRRDTLHGCVIGAASPPLETPAPSYDVPSPLYQSRIASPQKSATTPPSARNGPSGIADFRA